MVHIEVCQVKCPDCGVRMEKVPLTNTVSRLNGTDCAFPL
jgi:uncharacterized protein (UPF0212 family)